LATDRPVVVFDNRGMGESDVPEGPYSIEQLADDAFAVADAVGWRRFHLLGISMGGMIAQTMALMAGDRIERLVLGCTSHGGADQTAPEPGVMASLRPAPGAPRREMVGNMLRVNYTPEWIAADPSRFERMIDLSLAYRRSMRGLMHQMGAIMGFDVSVRIAGIDRPTLVVHGDRDVLLPWPNAASIAGKIPGAQLHTLRGAGHLFWDVDEGESARVIAAFLRGAV
jgi:pimeloyl-ACP methyl ester carboxylesterase